MTTLNPTLTAGGRATDATIDSAADSTTDTTVDAGPAPRRRLSGLQPTGGLHLGDYLGAIRPIIEEQDRVESVVMIADLHALAVTHDPARLRARTSELLATLVALGLDPDRTLAYAQSDVPEHAELHYLLECATGYGEASRMIQFREKATRRHHVRLSLLEILASIQNLRPATLATQFSSCGQLKQSVADAVVATLRPMGERRRRLRTEHAHLDQVRAHGAARDGLPGLDSRPAGTTTLLRILFAEQTHMTGTVSPPRRRRAGAIA